MNDAILLIPDPHGARQPGGTYLLWIELGSDVPVTFGRAGTFHLPTGHYAYAGSALGHRGSSALAHRLLRHATRCMGADHALRRDLAGSFGIPGHRLSQAAKRLHWHVDYLLERPEAQLEGVLAWCDGLAREGDLARWLAADEGAVPIAGGLGARDRPGETHLFRVPAGRVWWERVCGQAQNMAE